MSGEIGYIILANYLDFIEKLSVVIDKFDSLNERLVFINDGAVWIARFIQNFYSNITNILDFYHASEYLHKFSKTIFSKKTRELECKNWIDKQIMRIRGSICYLYSKSAKK